MIYDGDGNRVSKTVNGVTTQYLVDDLNPTATRRWSKNVRMARSTRQYTYGLQRISENQVDQQCLDAELLWLRRRRQRPTI